MIFKLIHKSLHIRNYCCCAPLYDLNGRIALITGATLGIGYETAKELLRNGVQRVCLADIDVKRGKKAVEIISKEFGPERAIFSECNLLARCNLEKAYEATLKRWGVIDIVINSAGILNDKDWEQEIKINCNGVVRGTQLAFQYMSLKNGGRGGVVVNLSSIFGLQVCGSIPVYTATKHFVMGYSRSLGTPFHYDKSGVRVLIMCPGVTLTTLVSKASTLQDSDEANKEVRRELDSFPPQPVEYVSRGIIYMIQRGLSGSVWVSEGAESVYEIAIPDRRGFRKKKCVY